MDEESHNTTAKMEKVEQKEQDIKFVATLTQEDKDAMKKEWNLVALRVPVEQISKIVALFKPHSFQRKGIKSFQPDPRNALHATTNKPLFKCLLLGESIKSVELDGLSDELRSVVQEHTIEAIEYAIISHYDDLSAHEVLQSTIHREDATLEIPTHYESVGHIVHFNLRDELLRYKYLIGQVFLDKLPNSVHTVVNKTGSITNEFRVFPMEIIAGKAEFVTTAKENGCRFSFDFSSVYWNSRLSTEHQRICDLLRPGDVVCDLMAGVGPFAVIAAKHKQCRVYANDLNPESVKYLRLNCKQNEVAQHVQCFNLDARAFWKQLCADKASIAQQNKKQKQFIDHVIMNLPAIAIEFLDVFRGCFDAQELTQFALPMIHCYCFAPDTNAQQSIRERLQTYLGVVPSLTEDALNIRLVRNVAPHKDMYCVSFRVPSQVALGDANQHINIGNTCNERNEEPDDGQTLDDAKHNETCTESNTDVSTATDATGNASSSSVTSVPTHEEYKSVTRFPVFDPYPNACDVYSHRPVNAPASVDPIADIDQYVRTNQHNIRWPNNNRSRHNNNNRNHNHNQQWQRGQYTQPPPYKKHKY